MVQNWVGPGGPGTRSQGRRCGARGGGARRGGAGAPGGAEGPRRDLGNFSSKHGIGTKQRAQPPPHGEGGGGTGATRPRTGAWPCSRDHSQPSRERQTRANRASERFSNFARLAPLPAPQLRRQSSAPRTRRVASPCGPGLPTLRRTESSQ